MRSPAFPMRALRFGFPDAVGARAARQAPKSDGESLVLNFSVRRSYPSIPPPYHRAGLPRNYARARRGVEARSCTCPTAHTKAVYDFGHHGAPGAVAPARSQNTYATVLKVPPQNCLLSYRCGAHEIRAAFARVLPARFCSDLILLRAAALSAVSDHKMCFKH